MNEIYKKQVSFLLAVLPEISKEECFALHGGTAINLFIRDMARLSVDIDLTYVPIEDRQTSFAKISEALERIKANIPLILPNSTVKHQSEISKLRIINSGVEIKVEVNQTNRGTIEGPTKRMLCQKAQEEFNVFCAVHVVQKGQLFGGKICAALDRQHPRDLFDVKYLSENEGFTEDVKKGFLLSALSSNRPIHELLQPNLQDQKSAFENQFSGMTAEPFTYDHFEATRTDLIAHIANSWTELDKQFLIGFSKLEPDWGIYDFERFPSIQWKIRNLTKLKETNPNKHNEQVAHLEKVLAGK